MKWLIFPGQGSQYSGMAKDWYANFNEAKLAFEEASDGCGLQLKKLCFEGSDTDLKQTEITQPAILTATVAIFRSLVGLGPVDGAYYAGHSLGEYSALVCMNVLSLGEAARLVNHRGKYMQEAVPHGVGAMAALVFKPDVEAASLARDLCGSASRASGKTVSVANYNSPMQIVISGHAQAVEAATQLSTSDQKFAVRKVVPLPVSAPFHCALMEPAAKRLEPELVQAKWNTQVNKTYLANVDAEPHALNNGALGPTVAQLLVQQITGSVQWIQSTEKAIALGCTEAVEIGPGTVLGGLVKRIKCNDITLAVRNIDRWEDYKNAGAKF